MTAAGTPALNRPLPERTVAEAIYERALADIGRFSRDEYARQKADEAIAAIGELRKLEKRT